MTQELRDLAPTAKRRLVVLVTLLMSAMVAAVAVASIPAPVAEGAPRADPLTEALYREYIDVFGKIHADSTIAAQVLMTDRIRYRFRSGGEWAERLVERLVELEGEGQRGAFIARRHLVVLIPILEWDGLARWAAARPEPMLQAQQEPPRRVPLVSEQVMARLITYAERKLEAQGREPGRDQLLDCAVTAVAASLAPEGRPLLRAAMETADVPVAFHAAVGLAEQNEVAGLRWLALHVDSDEVVQQAAHRDAKTREVGESCRRALEDLKDVQFETAEEWIQWAEDLEARERLDLPRLPTRRVNLALRAEDVR